MANQALDQKYPGAEAEKPQQIPAKGWLQILKRAWQEAKNDQVPLMAAGVAFFSFLALFPAMIAAVLVYGLIANPADVASQSKQLTQALPSDAASLITGQLSALTKTPQQALGIGLIVSLALALWSASGGVGNLITAINFAYDEQETRGFVKRKLLALGLTLGAIVFVVVAIALVAVAPAVLNALVPSTIVYWLLQIARWVVLIIAVSVVLALLYRWAPDRDDPKFQWVSIGALVATVIWILASLGFSLYVNNFGSYGKTYGALAGVVVLLLWLWITMYVVLLGAEVNAESEQQTVKDTTKGPSQPLRQRGAAKADALPNEDAEEVAEQRAQKPQATRGAK